MSKPVLDYVANYPAPIDRETVRIHFDYLRRYIDDHGRLATIALALLGEYLSQEEEK